MWDSPEVKWRVISMVGGIKADETFETRPEGVEAYRDVARTLPGPEVDPKEGVAMFRVSKSGLKLERTTWPRDIDRSIVREDISSKDLEFVSSLGELEPLVNRKLRRRLVVDNILEGEDFEDYTGAWP